MLDSELMLRAASDGDLDASEQARSWVDFGAGDVKPLTMKVVVPKADGTGPTLDLIIQTSDDGSTVQDTITLPQITEAGVYRVSIKSPHRYRRAYITLGGTSPDFGAVQIGPELGGEYTEY